MLVANTAHLQDTKDICFSGTVFPSDPVRLTNKSLLLFHPNFWQEMQEHISQQTSYSKAKQDSQTAGTTCQHNEEGSDN